MQAQVEFNNSFSKELPVDSAHMSYFVFPTDTKTYEPSIYNYLQPISKGTYNCYCVRNDANRIVRSGLKSSILSDDEESIGNITITDNDHLIQIVDPGYTYRRLIMSDVPLGSYVKFWGRDESHMSEYLQDLGYNIISHGYTPCINIDDKEKMKDVISEYHKQHPDKIVMDTFGERNMFYDNILAMHDNMINFEDIDENRYEGFVTMTGWGDGSYELTVTPKGYEVVFIDDYDEEESE